MPNELFSNLIGDYLTHGSEYIREKYNINSMLDIGCGPAGMVEYANYKGVYAIGVDGDPVCPQCWEEFLKANLGIGYCTIAWDPKGSEYENMMKQE